MKSLPVLAAILVIACSEAPSALIENATRSADQKLVTVDWPQWRGPNRDGVCAEKGLLSEWPKEGPPLLWKKKGFGRGYSSIAIAGNKLFTMGTRKNQQQLMAFQLADMGELWAVELGKNRGGDTRGTPTVDEDYVYGVGTRGDVICVQISTGIVIWTKNFGADFGGKMMSGWGYSESPLVDENHLIVCPGADEAMIVALDKRTGQVVWKSPMPAVGARGQNGAGYSGVVVSNAGNVKQYIAMVGRGVIGVRASDGKFLWSYNRIANGTANIPTVLAWKNFAFCSTGYGSGGALLDVSQDKPKEIQFLEGGKFQNHHGGMVRVQDYIYAGHGHNNGLPTCLDARTGQIQWQQRGPGQGSAAVLYAEGHLYFRYQDGIMALIEANPKAYKLKGQFTIAIKNAESWSHPVIHNAKLYLRDQEEMVCYDLKAK